MKLDNTQENADSWHVVDKQFPLAPFIEKFHKTQKCKAQINMITRFGKSIKQYS